MELFGLKDENGKEYKLVQCGNARMWKPELIEPESEFKVGDWIIGIAGYKPKCPSVILIIEEYKFTYDSYDEKDVKNNYWRDARGTYIRHCTPQEIESHLRKICDEKEYKKGVKFHPFNHPNWIQTIGDVLWYDESSDELHTEAPKSEWGKYCSNPIVYSNGCFAEIIPEKKRLPKTKEELIDIISEWDVKGGNLDDFLKDYED